MNKVNLNKKVVFVGNPNSGKSTLFNALTGLNQKTSNLSGTTIDIKTSQIKENDVVADLVDIPGIYSLYYKTKDEEIAVNYLIKEKIDLVVFVIDSTQIKRQLILLDQIKSIGIPCLIALTMNDIAKHSNIIINTEKLAELTECLVCEINARHNKGIKAFKNYLFKNHYLHHSLNETDYDNYKNFIKTYQIDKEKNSLMIENDLEQRFLKANEITNKVENRKALNSLNITQKIDKLALHPIFGFLLFFVVLYLMFQVVFKLADYPNSWIENSFLWITDLIKVNLPDNMFSNILTNGLLPGLSGVFVFLPQIILLFFILTLLEESGYMSRVSFISDRLMRKFGLNGKSIIPLIGGMACAIPAIMSARTINNQKERLITILVTPLMSCSARLPVFTTLAALFITNQSKSFFDYRALLILSLYLFGFLMALLFGLFFKYVLKLKEKSYFILELPTYKTPSWRNVIITIKDKVGDFVLNAGKIILLISLILWFLSSFAPGDAHKNIDKKYESYSLQDKNERIGSEKLESSYAGILGKTIEPAIKPLGYDWKIGIALITSFAAREVFVGTMATLYSISDSENTESLSTTLKKQKNIEGKPVYSFAVILSLLVFYTLAMQCISTLAVTYRETGSIKWPLIQLLYMTGFAYLMSFIIYQVFK